MLSSYGRREWMTIAAIGLMVTVTCLIIQWTIAAVLAAAGTLALLSFFRDPRRVVPADRNVMVSPADGRITSVHEVEHFDAFDGPALCIRIFMSVLNVHVNRSPCHAVVRSTTHQDGKHISALNPQSAEQNEWQRVSAQALKPLARSQQSA